MMRELFRALFQAGIPVAVTSYLLIWWAVKNQHLKGVSNLKEVEGHFRGVTKARSRKRKEEKRQRKKGGVVVKVDAEKQDSYKLNPVHNKWLSFGGGFYGVVGLLTYAVVELGEIRDFITQFDGFMAFFKNISVRLLFDLFIDSMMNFVVAIAWPAYWLSEIDGNDTWLWFVAAYAGYWAGIRLALYQANN